MFERHNVRSRVILLDSYALNRTLRHDECLHRQRVVSVDAEEIVTVDPVAFAAALAMERTGQEKVRVNRNWVYMRFLAIVSLTRSDDGFPCDIVASKSSAQRSLGASQLY